MTRIRTTVTSFALVAAPVAVAILAAAPRIRLG